MPLTDDFWVWVEETAAALDQLTYYQGLGVPEDADTRLVGDTYYGLVRRVHPDRHAREPAARKAALVRIYARIGEAHRVLGNPTLRARYDRAREGGAVVPGVGNVSGVRAPARRGPRSTRRLPG